MTIFENAPVLSSVFAAETDYEEFAARVRIEAIQTLGFAQMLHRSNGGSAFLREKAVITKIRDLKNEAQDYSYSKR